MATAALASPSKQSPSAMQRRARAGGIDEAPSSTSTARRGHAQGHSNSLSSPPTTLDKFFKSLLPQSAFPSSIVYAASSSSTSTSAVIASPVLEASGTRAGEVDYNSRPLSRSSSSSSLHQYASSPQYSSPSSPPHSSVSPLGPAAAAGNSKSKSRAPRSTVGAGKAAHAHRHNLSIDSSIPYASPLPSSNMVTRTRSRTALQSNTNNNARAPSPASFYAGGIGELLVCQYMHLPLTVYCSYVLHALRRITRQQVKTELGILLARVHSHHLVYVLTPSVELKCYSARCSYSQRHPQITW